MGVDVKFQLVFKNFPLKFILYNDTFKSWLAQFKYSKKEFVGCNSRESEQNIKDSEEKKMKIEVLELLGK